MQSCVASETCIRGLYLELQHIPTIKVNTYFLTFISDHPPLIPCRQKNLHPLGSGRCLYRRKAETPSPEQGRGSCCNALLWSGVTGPPAKQVKLGSGTHSSKTCSGPCFPSLFLTHCGVVYSSSGLAASRLQLSRPWIITRCNTSLAPVAGESRTAQILHAAMVLAEHNHCNEGQRLGADSLGNLWEQLLPANAA